MARLDATQTERQLAQLRAEGRRLTLDLWRLDARGSRRRPRSIPPGAAARGRRRRSARIAGAGPAVRRPPPRLRGQMASLRHQIDQLTAQVEANTGQATVAERQRALWADERANTANLVEKGATPKQRLLELDRNIATLEGDRDEALGLARAAGQEIARARSDMDGLRQQRLSRSARSSQARRARVEGLEPDPRGART